MRHVAIIMDGNGRWAKEREQPRAFGHAEGVVSVRKVLEAATKIGLEYLTVYTFSTENWERPEEEIVALMELLVSAVERETPDLMKNNIRLRTIGDLARLPMPAREALEHSIQTTAGNTGTTLILALSYSARWELTQAARCLAKEVERGCLKAEGITETVFADRLTTAGIPDPDLLIRTGGEKRISNFLLWQASYAELYFTDIFWPDFREEQLYEAIRDYQQRERRFGKTSEQLR
ncbi:MAG: isoprenyl transferase [Tannerellaceae bacterium]|jgi:undecaprenyl diphosphate synthase|nr:isoprenyl transferase [Tannerellaceae bacterium]